MKNMSHFPIYLILFLKIIYNGIIFFSFHQLINVDAYRFLEIQKAKHIFVGALINAI